MTLFYPPYTLTIGSLLRQAELLLCIKIENGKTITTFSVFENNLLVHVVINVLFPVLQTHVEVTIFLHGFVYKKSTNIQKKMPQRKHQKLTLSIPVTTFPQRPITEDNFVK